MTSILEALRELEEERRRKRTPGSTVSVAEMSADGSAPSTVIYPLVAGLAVGVLVVGLVVGWMALRGPGEAVPAAGTRGEASGGAAVSAAAADAATANAATARSEEAATTLDWLDRAAAPQARVEREGSTAAPSGSTPAAPAPMATARAKTAPTPVAAAGRVALESVRWAAAPERRAVTLRLDGRRVTLRQGEHTAGIAVQLIMEDGAYLERGSEVFFATPE